MSRIGYARVSTGAQNLDSQFDMLQGCDKVFADKVSGLKESRPEWDKMMEYLRPGDTLVVTELSRMSRSTQHMLAVVKELGEREINLRSLREHIDTSTATGRAFLAMVAVINQLEIELRAERAAAGRAAAKARGKTGGRPRIDPSKMDHAKILYLNSDMSAERVCAAVGIGKRTLFNYLRKQKIATEEFIRLNEKGLSKQAENLQEMNLSPKQAEKAPSVCFIEGLKEEVAELEVGLKLESATANLKSL